MKQLLLDLISPPAPSLGNFVEGRNGEALQTLRQLASDSGTSPPPAAAVVYLWGERACGKSHLIDALGSSPGFCKFDAKRFASDSAVSGAAPPSGDGRASDAAQHVVVLVDDVQRFTDQEQVALFNCINLVSADAHRGVVVAGDASPRDLPLRPELTSRLGSGISFQLHTLSDAEKASALRAHAKSRGFALRDDVIDYLLRHGRRDMRSLIQTLNMLDQYSLETGREITLPLLREMAQPQLA